MSADLLLPLTESTFDSALVAMGLVAARLGPAVWLAPFLGGRLVPVSVKTGLFAAIALILYPRVSADASVLVASGPERIVAVLAKEVLIGVAIGFVGALVFWGAQSAGWLADSARGATLAEVLVPQTGARTSPMGSLMLLLSIVIFLALGGHRIFISALVRSYEVLPLIEFPQIAGLRAFALFSAQVTAEMILLAVVLAAPVIATLLLADLALGWINRFAPQISVFFVAMPLKAILGVAVLATALAVLLAALPKSLELGMSKIDQALDLLAGR